MNIQQHNHYILSLQDEHPAKRFLTAFLECRQHCVGREIETPGYPSIDQKWYSQADGKQWKFSAFAYTYISFDVELDGWISNSPEMTECERAVLDNLPRLRQLLWECGAAAMADQNIAILELVEMTEWVFKLWENCIRVRTANTNQINGSRNN